jgi:hypothetical protein
MFDVLDADGSGRLDDKELGAGVLAKLGETGPIDKDTFVYDCLRLYDQPQGSAVQKALMAYRAPRDRAAKLVDAENAASDAVYAAEKHGDMRRPTTRKMDDDARAAAQAFFTAHRDEWTQIYADYRSAAKTALSALPAATPVESTAPPSPLLSYLIDWLF